MSGSGNARGGLGWVILVIALAVPGVLFYNWWSHLKAEREKSVAAKARGRVPEGGVFQSASPNAKLVNPMAPVVSTAAAASPLAASTDAVHVAAASSAQAAAISAVPAGALPAAAFSTTTASLPIKRDPTLSPFDQVRLEEEAEAKRRAAAALEEMNRPKAKKKAKLIDPSSMVNLQGIVSNPDTGFKAIVNDEVLGAGEFIGRTKIKIVRIVEQSVTFEYQGRKFKKGVSQE